VISTKPLLISNLLLAVARIAQQIVHLTHHDRSAIGLNTTHGDRDAANLSAVH
jgi:hypothetical protein